MARRGLLRALLRRRAPSGRTAGARAQRGELAAERDPSRETFARRHARALGIGWAAGVCPLVGWWAASSFDRATRSRFDALALTLMFGLAAVLAVAGNLVLGRSRGAAARAGVLAAAVTGIGFLVFVLLFWLLLSDHFR